MTVAATVRPSMENRLPLHILIQKYWTLYRLAYINIYWKYFYNKKKSKISVSKLSINCRFICNASTYNRITLKILYAFPVFFAFGSLSIFFHRAQNYITCRQCSSFYYTYRRFSFTLPLHLVSSLSVARLEIAFAFIIIEIIDNLSMDYARLQYTIWIYPRSGWSK